MVKSKFCGNCGNSLNSSDNFCTQCGNQIENSSQIAVKPKEKSKKQKDDQTNLNLDICGKVFTIKEDTDIAKKIARIMDKISLNKKLGEKPLWTAEEKTGLFKEPITYHLSNYRIFCLDPSDKKSMVFPLNYVDIVVMNSHRDSSRKGIGGFTSLVGGIGIGGFQSHGQSVTVGDVNFMCQGEIIVTIPNVLDPNGLKNFVNQLKKSMIQRLENLEVSENNKSNSSETKNCQNCGHKNDSDTNLCRKCGSVL